MAPGFGSSELASYPDNACFVCGPENKKGLHVPFSKSGERVTAIIKVTEEMQGFPGRMHSGLLYTILLDCAKWTCIGIKGRLGVPIRTTGLATRRWALMGETLSIVGRITRSTLRTVTVKVEAGDQNRALVAAVEREFELLGRRQFMVRLGYDELPKGLEDLVPP